MDALDERIARLSVNLHPDVARTLQGHAELAGISLTEAIRRAVAVWAFAQGTRQTGDALAVVRTAPDGSVTVHAVDMLD